MMLAPVVSSTLLATALASVSNILAQQLEQHKRGQPSTLSYPELLRFILLSILTAPPNFYWQHFLERSFPAYPPRDNEKALLPQHEESIELESTASSNSEGERTTVQSKLNWKNTAIKWFVDCITLGALLNTMAFLAIMGVLKGRTMGEIWKALQTETFPIIFASYKLWPVASVVNFTLVPVERRIVFLSGVGLAWGVYMSFMAAKQ